MDNGVSAHSILMATPFSAETKWQWACMGRGLTNVLRLGREGVGIELLTM